MNKFEEAYLHIADYAPTDIIPDDIRQTLLEAITFMIDKWMTVDSAPSDRHPVWCWGENRDRVEIAKADGEWWRSHQGMCAVTHWMDIKKPQPPPKEKNKPMSNTPTRIEVIDHRKDAPDFGRIPSSQVKISWQDGDRTLKIFLNDVEPKGQEDDE